MAVLLTCFLSRENWWGKLMTSSAIFPFSLRSCCITEDKIILGNYSALPLWNKLKHELITLHASDVP